MQQKQSQTLEMQVELGSELADMIHYILAIAAVNGLDMNEIILETEQGMLMIKGNELHVTRLSLEKGEVDVEGRVDSLAYSDLPSSPGRKESFFGRLFS